MDSGNNYSRLSPKSILTSSCNALLACLHSNAILEVIKRKNEKKAMNWDDVAKWRQHTKNTRLVISLMDTEHVPSFVTSMGAPSRTQRRHLVNHGSCFTGKCRAVCAQAFRSRSPFYMYAGTKVPGHAHASAYFFILAVVERRKFLWFYDK